MIEIKDLTKRFDGFTALQELNMTVPQASVYGLVGPNGAGKSTIIRHLTGVYYPDSGEVLVGARRSLKIRPSRRISPVSLTI